MQKFPTELLKEWFLENRRLLPWRINPTPYRVWISEVMLQQTQVSVVISYFEKWMEAFPTLEVLAQAPWEKVLKYWEGLGYYARARNLHTAARYIVENYHSKIPEEAEELQKIKGIGPYTQGAIRSFAFHQKAAAIDGNVKRLLSRFLACEEEVDTPRVKKMFYDYVEHLLPDDKPWLVSEGLIELGATVCMKKAKCNQCPLKQHCLAFRHHLQDSLPKKRARPQTVLLKRTVAVIVCDKHFLVQKREEGSVMAGLYEFPYLPEELNTKNAIQARFEEALALKLEYIQPLSQQKHTFTRFRAHLFPHLLSANSITTNHLWKPESALHTLAFSSGHKRIFNNLVI